MTLYEIQKAARAAGCYVVEKGDTKGPVYVLYRRSDVHTKGDRIGKSSSVEGLAKLLKKATNGKP